MNNSGKVVKWWVESEDSTHYGIAYDKNQENRFSDQKKLVVNPCTDDFKLILGEPKKLISIERLSLVGYID